MQQNLTQVYGTVRVVDESLERDGHVGTYLGPAETEGESVVKFDDDEAGQHDSFPNSSLVVL
jgi:hypothetical protein